MDLPARVKSAEEQSFELHNSFSSLEHRTREFMELQNALTDLHASVKALQTELSAVKGQLSAVQTALPTLARKEELDKFTEKLDAIPFEQLATKRDL